MIETANMDEGLPLVGEDSGNRSLWIGLAAICIAGLLLFTLLEANRQSSGVPLVFTPPDYATAAVPGAELLLPEIADQNGPIYRGVPKSLLQAQQTIAAVEPLRPRPPVRLERARPNDALLPPPSSPIPQNYSPPLPPQSYVQPSAPDAGRSAPAIVYDAFQAAVDLATNALTPGKSGGQAIKAVAVGGGDRQHLVSQGTLIFAVLETALDSTQAGQVRAMISSNVYNALGTQVLIPKGSRIFGEYKGELSTGQNRAQVIWTRLIRPDGATIALDSPASDQLGRAGIKGSVNTHFGQRLLNALLQSTINFGTAAASRAVTNGNGVVIALPTAGQEAGAGLIQPAPQPTLKVKHGSRIAVFVARDLDFSAVE